MAQYKHIENDSNLLVPSDNNVIRGKPNMSFRNIIMNIKAYLVWTVLYVSELVKENNIVKSLMKICFVLMEQEAPTERSNLCKSTDDIIT